MPERRRTLIDLAPNLAILVPNLLGAGMVYLYFNYVDPPRGLAVARRDLPVFVSLTVSVMGSMLVLGLARQRPLAEWLGRVRAGADPHTVPADVRRRALNAPLVNAVTSMLGWVIAGTFYFPYTRTVAGLGPREAWRVLAGIVLVGGPVASALAFLVAEFYWRRRIPLLFPEGRLEREGVFRLPVRARLAATFLVTAVLPPLLMLLATFGVVERFAADLPAEAQRPWLGLLRTQAYLVGATGIVSVAMAFLVARFINHPVEALRRAMASVAVGDLSVRVPVRSVDELGELNERFNAMVEELRRARRVHELFGRYVNPAVARQALERGIALGGELTRATAMFVDLRGFTAMTQRVAPERVVEALSEFYALVERACDREHGIITQFLGDGVVAVFGAPLEPLPDHAARAVRAAVALQQSLADRNAHGGERLLAGIGICTGDMIAGNVGTGDRVTYTIVGDAVNQAARLQVKTRDLDADILVTESTRAALGGAGGLVLRSCGPVPLKGIAAPVEVYAVRY